MPDIPTRDVLQVGMAVEIVTKADQRTGRVTGGTIRTILTASRRHPHGIKVRLADGQVGRVKRITRTV